MNLYLSRLVIAKSPEVSALDALLNPRNQGQRRDAHHRLIWSAFAGDPDASRDFLWRYMGKGQFLVLSHRKPEHSALFDPPDIQSYAPDLQAGDRLSFILRANATDRQSRRINRKRKRA